VTTLEMEKVKLADLKGKLVIVTCFGTWHAYCRDEMPVLVKLASDLKERGDPVYMIGFSWERADPNEAIEKDVKDFVADKKINFPVALMKQKDPILDRIPDLRGFPTTLWIDKNGKVRARAEDLRTYEELEAVTKALLNEGAKKDKKAEDKKADEKKADKPDEKKPDEKKPDEKAPKRKDEEPF
jgi:thiol-disulfide isomerase/thioredoxin